MDKKELDEIVAASKRKLLIYNLFVAGWLIYATTLCFIFGPLRFRDDFYLYSVVIWGFLCICHVRYIKINVLCCPVCGTRWYTYKRIIFKYPKSCKNCGAELNS